MAVTIALAGGVALARSIDRDNRQRFGASLDLFESVIDDQLGGYRAIGAILPAVLGAQDGMFTVGQIADFFEGADGGFSVVSAIPLEGLAGVGFLTFGESGTPQPVMLPNGADLTNATLTSDPVLEVVDLALATGRAQTSLPIELPGSVRYVYVVPSGNEVAIVEFVNVTSLLSGAGYRSDARLVEALAIDVDTGETVARTGALPSGADAFERLDISILGRDVAVDVYPGDGFDWSPGWIPGIWFGVLWLAIAGLAYVVGVVTRRRNAEQEARLGLAKRIIEDKDRFIAAVSHELRTPLTAVVGLAEELTASLQSFSEEELLELTSIVAQESREMSLLVEDLLVAARIEDGEVSVNPESVDVDRQIAAVQAGVGAIGANIVAGESGTSAWVDPLRLRQILRNLATNAVRHGGPSIHIRASNGGDRTQIEVWDDGDPVSDEARERMFEPYYRSTVDNGQAPSVGLGLSVSYRLAEMMGSRLTYRYENGWSVFCLDLPKGPR